MQTRALLWGLVMHDPGGEHGEGAAGARRVGTCWEIWGFLPRAPRAVGFGHLQGWRLHGSLLLSSVTLTAGCFSLHLNGIS